MEHECAIDMNKFYLREQRQLKDGYYVAIQHLMRFSVSRRLASILPHVFLSSHFCTSARSHLLRPHVPLLLASRSLLPFLPSFFPRGPSATSSLVLSVPSTTFPPSLPHEPSPFRCCPFCRCRSASADSGCPLVHCAVPQRLLGIPRTGVQHRSWPCFHYAFSARVTMRLSDALILREVCNPNSS